MRQCPGACRKGEADGLVAAMQRTIFRPDHRDYRESVKRLAAAKGMLAMGVGEEWGGSGVDDLRFNQTLVEEFA